MLILRRARLVNWHFFSDSLIELGPATLLGGDNGSGKSTIVDAIQYALVAQVGKIRFNAAASERRAARGLQDRRPMHDMTGLVYTAGHANVAVMGILHLCAAAGACIRHYGDLDPDGILILQEIQAALKAPVAPWLMTADVHRRYARHGYALDGAQIARLKLLRADMPRELHELAREIADTGRGVEQEIIDVGMERGVP
jgi:energy-coupling factor transporter ATP-binding protein EcfA2